MSWKNFAKIFTRPKSSSPYTPYQFAEGFLYDPQAQRLVFERVQYDPLYWFAGPASIPQRMLAVTSGPQNWQNLVLPYHPQQGFIPEGVYTLEPLQNDPVTFSDEQ